MACQDFCIKASVVYPQTLRGRCHIHANRASAPVLPLEKERFQSVGIQLIRHDFESGFHGLRQGGRPSRIIRRLVKCVLIGDSNIFQFGDIRERGTDGIKTKGT